MKQLTAEQIQENWDIFIGYIEKYITGDRKDQLLEFYNKLQDRLIVYPASNNTKYHNCIPGGYIDHVNRVIKGSIYVHKLWTAMGGKMDNYTMEELIFSAINHDLGKIGDQEHQAYLPSTDAWRIKNLGEIYTFNNKLNFMSVPDRSIFLLQEAGIPISQNEFIGIKTHDGLYDQANEAYLKSYSTESKPRTNLTFVLHQADMMAARIEAEGQILKPLI